MSCPDTVAFVQARVDQALKSYYYAAGMYDKACLHSGGRENRRVRLIRAEREKREERLKDARRELVEVQTSLERNLVKPEIEPGCWVVTNFGNAVCVEVSRYCVYFRYSSRRYGDDRQLWVGNGDPWYTVTFLRPADDWSRHVMTLEGPYGLEE